MQSTWDSTLPGTRPSRVSLREALKRGASPLCPPFLHRKTSPVDQKYVFKDSKKFQKTNLAFSTCQALWQMKWCVDSAARAFGVSGPPSLPSVAEHGSPCILLMHSVVRPT